MTNGKPGALEEFVTGFVTKDGSGGAPLERWGRPVGVTVARDGSLLISDDGKPTGYNNYPDAADNHGADGANAMFCYGHAKWVKRQNYILSWNMSQDTRVPP